MQILKPNIRFNIVAAARIWPNFPAISNLDILQKFPRTAQKSAHFHQKMDEKIRDGFGYVNRYWSYKPWESLDQAINITTETLAKEAVEKVFSQCDQRSLQAFLFGSTTNKRYTGSQAAAVLGQFGLQLPAYDLKAGCSTSLATFHLAYALMSLGYNHILVSCAETLSKVIDPRNEKTWFGVADGAAALWLQKTSTGHFTIEKSFFTTDGTHADIYTTPGVLPPTHSQLDNHDYSLQGDEMLLKDLALERYLKMIDYMLPSQQERAEINWIIPHQVNRKIIDYVIEQKQLKNAQLLWDADQFGNLGGTSILFTLVRAIEEKVFNQNGKILLMSVGGGLSFAAQVIDYRIKPDGDQPINDVLADRL